MIAYTFRFMQDDEPTGWVGFAFAANKRDLFWQIDSHGDPYQCEIKTITCGSVCAYFAQDADSPELPTMEVHDWPIDDNAGWKKPKWEGIHD